MRLTKQSGYALRIVVDCASNPDRLTRIADIARRYNITKHNIAKTVPILVRHGIVDGVRGRNGGIRLARPASEITIGEIVRASETTHVVADCFGGEHIDCAIRPAAPINRMLDEALEAFISVLDQHTVADMVARRGGMDGLGLSSNADEESDPPARKRRAQAQARTSSRVSS